MAEREREVGSNVLPFRRPPKHRHHGCSKCTNWTLRFEEMENKGGGTYIFKCRHCGFSVILVTSPSTFRPELLL